MEFSELLTGIGFTNFFVKAFSVVFSILYLIYSLVILKQIKIMVRSISLTNSPFVVLISRLQVFISLILIILSVMLN